MSQTNNIESQLLVIFQKLASNGQKINCNMTIAEIFKFDETTSAEVIRQHLDRLRQKIIKTFFIINLPPLQPNWTITQTVMLLEKPNNLCLSVHPEPVIK